MKLSQETNDNIQFPKNSKQKLLGSIVSKFKRGGELTFKKFRTESDIVTVHRK